MSQYNTAKETNTKTETLTKSDSPVGWSMKADISTNHESILRNLFNALFVGARQHSVKTDHTPSQPNIMTLDIYQVQQLIDSHCGKLITHMEIIDALYDLAEPKLLMPSTTAVESEIDGRRINAIRLDYGKQTETKLVPKTETDNLAKELSQVDLTLRSTDKADSPDSATQSESEQSCQSTAVEFREQQIVDRDTIQSLRGIIIDMAETLHVADPNARISMTSSDLLDLINSQNDMSDNAF
ncbi:hypothetical protein ACTXJ5_05740 [Psychrobacter alimentarius]|uniref:hypothetical protein n=1 Tax=Psychrobacter alimentarius TaxID=261164 RepID=UPI003FD04CFA